MRRPHPDRYGRRVLTLVGLGGLLPLATAAWAQLRVLRAPEGPLTRDRGARPALAGEL